MSRQNVEHSDRYNADKKKKLAKIPGTGQWRNVPRIINKAHTRLYGHWDFRLVEIWLLIHACPD